MVKGYTPRMGSQEEAEKQARVRERLRVLGTRLKQAREAAGVTADEAAAAVGRDPVTVWRYENGQYAPRIHELEALAQRYQADLLWIIGAEGRPAGDALGRRIEALPERQRALVEELVATLEEQLEA